MALMGWGALRPKAGGMYCSRILSKESCVRRKTPTYASCVSCYWSVLLILYSRTIVVLILTFARCAI